VSLLSVLLLTATVGAGPAAFIEVGTHPGAAQQTTDWGRMLVTLKAWNGRVYAGYGDLNANTGPITVMGFDPATRTFHTEWVSDTEAILIYRAIGDELYAPAADRRAAADYAVGPPWRDVGSINTSHAWDMVSLTGSDLWLLGSLGVDAIAWRSLDGGETWAEALRVGPAEGTFYARFYFGGVYQGKLHLQAAPLHTVSKVYDGQAWADGPDLFAGTGAPGWHAEAAAGRLLYQSSTYAEAQLFAFDGAQVQALPIGPIWDYAVAEGAVFALGADGVVRCSRDLASWRTLGQAPSTARSITALRNAVFTGTLDSRLFRMRLGPRLRGCPPSGRY
jgi:hypothetical protein